MADIFDRDGDGYIDYYEFVAALHPNKDAYRPTTDADKIEDEVRTPPLNSHSSVLTWSKVPTSHPQSTVSKRAEGSLGLM